jgi:hypothetical protein
VNDGVALNIEGIGIGYVKREEGGEREGREMRECGGEVGGGR